VESDDVSDTQPATVSYVSADRVARVTIDRPPLNVLDRATVRALDAALARAVRDGVSVLVLEGAGTRAFSAGVSVEDHDPAVVRETLALFHGVFRRLYAAPYVTISKVRGHCLGGGAELALFCDIAVASDNARFGLPEIGLGCFPPVAISAFPYRFGRAALELVLTGEQVDALAAQRAGLVTRWVPRDELDEYTDRLAAHIARQSAPVVALAVRTARQLWSPGFERALEDAERAYLEELLPLPDHAEGLAAFREKREPRFTHRPAPPPEERP
jgi:cyclohexa-1,5-dienecarbonyl-CoA hydratase